MLQLRVNITPNTGKKHTITTQKIVILGLQIAFFFVLHFCIITTLTMQIPSGNAITKPLLETAYNQNIMTNIWNTCR